jgi:hypothetical protein
MYKSLLALTTAGAIGSAVLLAAPASASTGAVGMEDLALVGETGGVAAPAGEELDYHHGHHHHHHHHHHGYHYHHHHHHHWHY